MSLRVTSEALLDLARQFAAGAGHSALSPLSVLVTGPTWREEMRSEDAGPPLYELRHRPAKVLILAVLLDAKKPLRAHLIARRCGRACTGWFRQVLSRLIGEGVVVRRADGYWLASREMPNGTELF